jgi:hypothetical protein
VDEQAGENGGDLFKQKGNWTLDREELKDADGWVALLQSPRNAPSRSSHFTLLTQDLSHAGDRQLQ